MSTSANEKLGTLAENNPLTGYEPNFIDNYHISETTDTFIQESFSDSRPSNMPDWAIRDYTVGRALSSPLFQEREEPAGRRQAYHSPEESLLSVCHARTGRPVHELGSLSFHAAEKNQVATQKMSKSGFSLNDNKSKFSPILGQRSKNTSPKPILIGEVSRN